jgi:hypothetical protein
MFIQAALMWVAYSKTAEAPKALSVIMHRKSLRVSEGARRIPYVLRKVRLKQVHHRWGGHRPILGDHRAVEQAEGEEQKITDGETLRLKRFLRRYLHGTQKRKKRLKDGSVMMVRPKRRYERASRNDRFAGFAAIREETAARFLRVIEGHAGRVQGRRDSTWC